MLRAPQDDCWDRNCPFNMHDPIDKIRADKLACFQTKKKEICRCCRDSNAPNCYVQIPGTGAVDACDENTVEGYSYGKTSYKFLDMKTMNGKIELAILIVILLLVIVLIVMAMGKKKKTSRRK